MYAAVLTVLLATGAPERPVDDQQQPTMVGEDYDYGACQECEYPAGRCRQRGDVAWGCLINCLGPMPQTCYAPRFGCYPGNNRHMHRYPAFHAYYYRQAYNYRHLFDYPWHATPYAPQGFVTYQIDGQAGEEIRTPQPEQGVTPSGPLQPFPMAP